MYSNEDVKKAYFAERYKKQKDKYKATQAAYWENKTKETLGKDEVTEEEIRQCYNEYFRSYRKKNVERTKKNADNFWERKRNEVNNNENSL